MKVFDFLRRFNNPSPPPDEAPPACPFIRPSIGFIDDLFRHSFWPAKEFFYELPAEPLRHVLGAPAGPSVRRQMWRDGLLTPPSVPAGPTEEADWLSQYASLRQDSKDIIKPYIDPDALYICYEASPGLCAFLDELGIVYIDIRISPLRFLPDLLIALRSNSAEINAVLAQAAITRHDIAREASLLAASFRHLERYGTGTPPAEQDVPVFFVGQTSTDASLISGQKRFTLNDAEPLLSERLSGRKVAYLQHPSATAEHMQGEIAVLSRFASSVEPAQANSYDLLCSEAPCEFLSISSGLIQEAEFFDKKAYRILPPVCPLDFPGEAPGGNGYHQITFDTFVSDPFWSAILRQGSMIDRDSLRNMKPNRLRELHDVWWGYAAHKARPNDYTRAQNRETLQQLKRLEETTQFLMELVSTEPDARAPAGDDISRHRWQWISGGVVSFDPDGIIRRDGVRAGIWRRLAKMPDGALAIWDGGIWMDAVHHDGNGVLHCRNNAGDRFQVLAARPEAAKSH